MTDATSRQTTDDWSKIDYCACIFFSGLHATYKYCDKFKLPYKKCGKLVVATNQIEVDRLESLYSRAIQNKVPDVKLLDDEKAIQEIEPYCKGLKAIHSPHTGNY